MLGYNKAQVLELLKPSFHLLILSAVSHTQFVRHCEKNKKGDDKGNIGGMSL